MFFKFSQNRLARLCASAISQNSSNVKHSGTESIDRAERREFVSLALELGKSMQDDLRLTSRLSWKSSGRSVVPRMHPSISGGLDDLRSSESSNGIGTGVTG